MITEPSFCSFCGESAPCATPDEIAPVTICRGCAVNAIQALDMAAAREAVAEELSQ